MPDTVIPAPTGKIDAQFALELVETAYYHIADGAKLTFKALWPERAKIVRQVLAQFEALPPRVRGQEDGGAKKNWLMDQLQRAADDFATWPKWMQDAARYYDGSVPSSTRSAGKPAEAGEGRTDEATAREGDPIGGDFAQVRGVEQQTELLDAFGELLDVIESGMIRDTGAEMNFAESRQFQKAKRAFAHAVSPSPAPALQGEHPYIEGGGSTSAEAGPGSVPSSSRPTTNDERSRVAHGPSQHPLSVEWYDGNTPPHIMANRMAAALDALLARATQAEKELAQARGDHFEKQATDARIYIEALTEQRTLRARHEEAVAKVLKKHMEPNAVCERLGGIDPETGANECSRRDCLCAERQEEAEAISAEIALALLPTDQGEVKS